MKPRRNFLRLLLSLVLLLGLTWAPVALASPDPISPVIDPAKALLEKAFANSEQPLQARDESARVAARPEADRIPQRVTGDPVDNTRDQLKDMTDNVREKLNLDEPLDPTTRELIDEAQDKAQDVGQTITKRRGFFNRR